MAAPRAAGGKMLRKGTLLANLSVNRLPAVRYLASGKWEIVTRQSETVML